MESKQNINKGNNLSDNNKKEVDMVEAKNSKKDSTTKGKRKKPVKKKIRKANFKWW